MTKQQVPLTGEALLEKIKQVAELSKTEKARACGYLSPSGRVDLTSFMGAILEAKGLGLTNEYNPGRQLSYRVTVHSSGQIIIGVAYTSQMGLSPGDSFEIRMGYKHIHLNKVE